MNPSLSLVTPPGEALARLCATALGDSGQARRIADFLLAWHNAPENGAWFAPEIERIWKLWRGGSPLTRR